MEKLSELLFFLPMIIAFVLIMGWSYRHILPLAETTLRAWLLIGITFLGGIWNILLAIAFVINMNENSAITTIEIILFSVAVVMFLSYPLLLAFAWWGSAYRSGSQYSKAEDVQDDLRNPELENYVRGLAERLSIQSYEIIYSTNFDERFPCVRQDRRGQFKIILPYIFCNIENISPHLPMKTVKAYQHFVLSHELAHIKNGDARTTLFSIILRKGVWGWLRMYVIFNALCLGMGFLFSSSGLLFIGTLLGANLPSAFSLGILLSMVVKLVSAQREQMADMAGYLLLPSDTKETLMKDMDEVYAVHREIKYQADKQAESGEIIPPEKQGWFVFLREYFCKRLFADSEVFTKHDPLFGFKVSDKSKLSYWTNMVAKYFSSYPGMIKDRLIALTNRLALKEQALTPSREIAFCWGYFCIYLLFVATCIFGFIASFYSYVAVQDLFNLTCNILIFFIPLPIFVLPLLSNGKTTFSYKNYLKDVGDKWVFLMLGELLATAVLFSLPYQLLSSYNENTVFSRIIINLIFSSIILLYFIVVLATLISHEIKKDMIGIGKMILQGIFIIWPFILTGIFFGCLAPDNHFMGYAVVFMLSSFVLGMLWPKSLNLFPKHIEMKPDLDSFRFCALKYFDACYRWDLSCSSFLKRYLVTIMLAGATALCVLFLPGIIITLVLHFLFGFMNWPLKDIFVLALGIGISIVFISSLKNEKKDAVVKALPREIIKEFYAWLFLIKSLTNGQDTVHRFKDAFEKISVPEYKLNDLLAWRDNALEEIYMLFEIHEMLDLKKEFEKYLPFIKACQNKDGGFGRWPGAFSDLKSTLLAVEMLKACDANSVDMKRIEEWGREMISASRMSLENACYAVKLYEINNVPLSQDIRFALQNLLNQNRFTAQTDYEAIFYRLYIQKKILAINDLSKGWLEKQILTMKLKKIGQNLPEFIWMIKLVKLWGQMDDYQDVEIVRQVEKGAGDFVEQIGGQFYVKISKGH